MKIKLNNQQDNIAAFLAIILVTLFGWKYGILYTSVGLSIFISLIVFCFQEKINNMNEKIMNNLLLLLSGGLGAVFFVTILSPKILNTSYINWLLARGDPAQHFLGWHFFRNDPWSLPPGLISSLNTPIGTSITYTDSIPLLAFSFKIFNSLLPETFQYLGIWILLCYILQGVFGLLLMRKITSNFVLQFLGIMFFIMSPIMLWRAYGHEALMGHWIILASLYLYKSLYKNLWWLFLLMVSLLVHPYLFLMVFIVYFIKVMELFFTRKITITTCLINYLSAALLILIVLWCIGYFYIGSSGVSDGFGNYSMNINSIFNPQGWSHYFLKDQPSATPGQYEGFNYLGLGTILLLVCSLYSSITNYNKNIIKIKDKVGVVIISIIFISISISNVVTYSNHILFTIPLPGIAMKIGGIVRASGRFFWPVYYMIIILSLTSLIRNVKKKAAALLLILALSFQFADLSGKFTEFHNMYSNEMKWETPLRSNIWGEIDGGKYNNIVFVPSNVNSQYVAFSMLAAKKNMTINAVYTARDDYEKREAYNNNLLQDIEKGNFKSKDIYIIDNSMLKKASEVKKDTDLLISADGFNVLIPNGKEDPNFKDINLDLNSLDYKYGEVISFGTNGKSSLIKRSGWSFAEENYTWTEGNEASLIFSVKQPDKDLVLSIKMSPLLGGDIKGQHLILFVNNQQISESIIDSNNTYQFNIPKDIVKDELHISLRLPDAVSPKSLGLNEDNRQLALSIEYLSVK
jgi:hypothetical protein